MSGARPVLQTATPRVGFGGAVRRNVWVSGKITFEVGEQYVVEKLLGHGAYGVVCRALDRRTGQRVAIKKLAAPCVRQLGAKRTLREIRILRAMNHSNILSITSIDPPLDYSAGNDLYFVTESMDADLHQIINSHHALSMEHVAYFAYQICRGLKYIHSAGIIHRDLKPSNLLTNANCDLRIIDFGLSRAVNEVEKKFLTEYIATRWYRAPEIMLSYRRYTSAVDMWAVGCILAEMVLRKSLFPGKNYLEQLTMIFRVIGKPTAEELSILDNPRALAWIQSQEESPRANFKVLFRDASPECIDLLERLLVFSPDQRPTAAETLRHPFFAALHRPDDEPEAPGRIGAELEDRDLSLEELHYLINVEIQSANPHLPSPMRPVPPAAAAAAAAATPQRSSEAPEGSSASARPPVYQVPPRQVAMRERGRLAELAGQGGAGEPPSPGLGAGSLGMASPSVDAGTGRFVPSGVTVEGFDGPPSSFNNGGSAGLVRNLAGGGVFPGTMPLPRGGMDEEEEEDGDASGYGGALLSAEDGSALEWAAMPFEDDDPSLALGLEGIEAYSGRGGPPSAPGKVDSPWDGRPGRAFGK